MFGTLSVANRLPGALSSVIGVEQPVLRLGRQIAEQALGAPGRRLVRVEARFDQRRGPVVAQVDRDRAAVGGRLGAEVGQRPGLELDHLRLVDLVHAVPAGQASR